MLSESDSSERSLRHQSSWNQATCPSSHSTGLTIASFGPNNCGPSRSRVRSRVRRLASRNRCGRDSGNMGEFKHSMKIALITPAGARSRSGNRHTATRWAAMLTSLGHRVRVSVRWDGRAADAMIALHARRSHASIVRFRERFPASPLVVVLTGTDLYRDMRSDRRYRWLGNVPHRAALGWLSRSDLLVLSSRMEGGANVICEAAAAGVPVIASRVSGNIGMLGRGYPGYYRLADERSLARQMRRAALDPAYYARLERLTAARRPLFRPAAEREGLRRLLAELAPRPKLSRSRISRTG